MATSLRPQRCPSPSSTWVTRWSSGSTWQPCTRPISPSRAWTGSPRSMSVAPSGTTSWTMACTGDEAPVGPPYRPPPTMGLPGRGAPGRPPVRAPADNVVHQLHLLGRLEPAELLHGAAQPDALGRAVDQVERDEPACPHPGLRLA